jgi:hypothetical protein
MANGRVIAGEGVRPMTPQRLLKAQSNEARGRNKKRWKQRRGRSKKVRKLADEL